MRPRLNERRAEIRITDFPFERPTQRVTVQRDAEAFLVELLRNVPDRHFWKLIDFFCHSLPNLAVSPDAALRSATAAREFRRSTPTGSSA